MTVLIVDQDESSRGLIKRVLETLLELTAVVETGRSEEGIRLARELRPNLLLIDSSMVEGDVLAAIGRIKAEQPETRIVVLAAFASHLPLRSYGLNGHHSALEAGTLPPVSSACPAS